MKTETLSPRYPLDHLAPLGRVGVISLATDFNIEHDLRRIYPDGVEMFTSRVRNFNPLTIENLRTMAPGISAVADAILPGTELDVIIYACTSGTVAIGSKRVEELIHAARPDVKVTNPLTAAFAAFDALQAGRISMLTPYTDTVNGDVARVFSGSGCEVLNIAGFGFEDDTAMTFISPRDIEEAAIEICHPDADLLFISCTALRSAQVVEHIEQRLSKPVITSNQVLAWHSLSLMHHPGAVFGYGQLLSSHLSPESDIGRTSLNTPVMESHHD
ncbi:maleate cis-trans isomerase family protein [Zobellella maritima]|uniref:maleate cis-trans isomerase family protein n=1 Tax=Zobellella maritima TaxID=2059725 RepID=UPI000E3034CD|nr:Asp/Glu racemase [Zobellella maritima]